MARAGTRRSVAGEKIVPAKKTESDNKVKTNGAVNGISEEHETVSNNKKENVKSTLKVIKEKTSEEVSPKESVRGIKRPAEDDSKNPTPENSFTETDHKAKRKSLVPRGRPSKKTKVDPSNISVPTVSLSAPSVVGGVVLAVGTGDVGQLGLGEDVLEKVAVVVVPDLPTNIVAVAAGGLHSLCVDDQGFVHSWGCNDEGGLGRTTKEEEDNFTPGKVEGIEGKVVQITAGDCHSIALTEHGSVYGWGTFRDNNGTLGFLTKCNLQKAPVQLTLPEPAVSIASGNNHAAILSSSGEIFTFGCGESGQLGRLAEAFASRDARNRNTFDILLKPSIVKIGRGKKKVKFDAVWAGEENTFGRCAETGAIYACGLNNYNQIGVEDTNTKFQPVTIKALKEKKITKMDGGQHHGLCLEGSPGSVLAMGRHDYGRLGLGEEFKKDALKPTKITGFEEMVEVSAAGSVSVVVSKQGEVLGFGMGTNNQLSQGNDDDCWSPTVFRGKALAERKVVQASVGGQHTMLLAVPK